MTVSELLAKRLLTRDEYGRLRSAVHEAGHACAALLHGVKFSHVWIGSECDRRGGLHHHDDWVAGDITREGIEAMAGLAGERLALGHPVESFTQCDYEGGAYGDFSDLVNHYVGQSVCDNFEDGWDGTPEFAKKFVNTSLRKAYALLRKHAALHARLGDALLERKRLSYDRCRALFDSAKSAKAGSTL